MSNEFEEKVNNDIRMMKQELVEIKEILRSLQSDMSRLLSKNYLSRSTSSVNFESYKNEKRIDSVPESPRTKNASPKVLKLTSSRDSSLDISHFRRRATESNIVYSKPSH